MKGVPLIQIFSTGVGLALVAMGIVLRRKSGTKNPYDPDNGLDPNFPGGKPIQPQGPVDPNDFKRPSCQTWNTKQNLFENAGHPEWDSSEDNCFVQTNVLPIPDRYNVRYVDANGNLTWKAANPFEVPASENGKCIFYDGTALSSFPDFGTEPAPPNRAARLCFDSGLIQDKAGMMFINGTDGSRQWNPNVFYGAFGAEVARLEFDNPWGVPTATGGWDFMNGSDGVTDHCEAYKTAVHVPTNSYPNPGSDTMTLWAATEDVAQFTTLQTCVTDGNKRFVMPSQKKIVYMDPLTSQLVETPMLDLNGY